MESVKRLDYVDALRGLAIFGVLIVHSLGFLIASVSVPVGNLISNGARGVQLFFIVSAFTLFLSLENKKNEKHVILNYFIRRFFRIAPLFYLVILYAVLPEVRGVTQRFSFLEIVSTLIFVNGWHPKWINSILSVNWTIAVEMGFYVILPFLFRKIKTLASSIYFVLGTGVALNFLMNFLVNHPLWSVRDDWIIFLHQWLPSQLPIFGLGIILYFLVYPERQLENKKKESAGKRLFLFGLMFFGFISLLYDYPLVEVNSYGLVFLFLAFLLSRYPIKILVNKFWMYLGKISFSVYLIHLLALSFVKQRVSNIHEIFGFHGVFFDALIVFVPTLFLSMLIATLTYKFIEKPGIIMGNKLIEKIETGEYVSFVRFLDRVKCLSGSFIK